MAKLENIKTIILKDGENFVVGIKWGYKDGSPEPLSPGVRPFGVKGEGKDIGEALQNAVTVMAEYVNTHTE